MHICKLLASAYSVVPFLTMLLSRFSLYPTSAQEEEEEEAATEEVSGRLP
jgi:hypothetical protein